MSKIFGMTTRQKNRRRSWGVFCARWREIERNLRPSDRSIWRAEGAWTLKRGCVIHCSMTNQTTGPVGAVAPTQTPLPVKVKYCLYARKSTESEEQQILSIDSQIKEMMAMAERDHLEIVEIKKESHSAKEAGQRPVFNEIVEEIKSGKFNGILTWAADRISRNAGDLGRIVDLMD